MAQARWKKLVDDLLRLAQDAGATEDERNTARLKLAQVLEKHPDAQEIEQYEPLREFTFRDFREMKRRGIYTGGSWTGATLEDAVAMMIADYRRRLTPKLARSSNDSDLRGMVAELEATLAALQ